MSTYDEASLIFYPSGYKESKLYNLKPIPYLGSELVVNGDFEVNLNGWTNSNGATIFVRNTTTPISGVADFRMVGASGLWSGAITSLGTLTQGKTYLITFNYRNVGSYNNNISIVKSASSIGTPFSGISGKVIPLSLTNTLYSYTVTAGETSVAWLSIYDGYSANASEIYIDNVSVKEVINDADLTFTRASTATRVNAAGLIEGVRTNLITYSDQFDNAAWSKANCAVTANQIESPDGTINADLITTTSTSHALFQGFSVTANTAYTFSFYVKRGTMTDLSYRVYDLSNSGDIVSPTSYYSQTTLSGWSRITLTFTAPVGCTSLRVYPIANSGVTGTVYLYGAQLEQSPSATEYIPTTTTAVSVGMLANIPRIDYTGGGCGKLLLEPQRSNLVTFSESFDNAAWTKDGSTATANVATSPDGYTNADKLFETAVTDFHRVYGPTISVTSGTAYTASIFVKAAEVTTFVIELRLTANVGSATFDLVAGTATGAGIIQDYGNGWYRCIFTATATATGNGRQFFYIKQASSYAGNASNGILIYGASLEAGSYATSYIPTTSTSVTRVADSASKTGISSLINSVEGVLYAEIAALANDGTYRQIVLGDGSINNVVQLMYSNTSNQIRVIYRIAGTATFDSTFVVSDVTLFLKIAFKYKLNDFALWINGVERTTSNSGAVLTANTLNTLRFDSGAGASPFYGKVQNVMIFPSALSDATLATLTTL